MPKKLLKKWLLLTCNRILKFAEEHRRERMYVDFNIDPTVRLGNIELIGNIEIGRYTYVNSGTVLSSGENSKVTIGRYCAIGRYVHASAKTHSQRVPTADESHLSNDHLESDVKVGDYTWIGDKVYIREGVSIGKCAIIGANSVVTNDVADFEVVAGVPARHIKFNTSHHRYPTK